MALFACPWVSSNSAPLHFSRICRAATLRTKDAFDRFDLSGPVEMDHEQMAAELSEALGRKIVFQDLPNLPSDSTGAPLYRV